MKRFIHTICLFGLIFSIVGCVTIFGRKEQKVKITSATSDAHIQVNKDTYQNDTVKTKLSRVGPYTISASKEGYKTRRDVLSPQKTSLLIYGDLAGGIYMIGLVALVVDASFSPIKMRRYPFKYEIPELQPLPSKTDGQKFIWVEDAFINIKENDVIGKLYSSVGNMKRDKAFEEYKADEDGIYDAPQFKHDMNNILLSYGYTDTSENVIPYSWNSLFLTSEIKTINTNVGILKGRSDIMSMPNVLMNIDLEIEWTLFDGFGNVVLTALTSGTSDNIWSKIKLSDSKFQKSMKDAIEYAMLDLFDNTQFEELLALDTDLATGKNNKITEIVRTPSTNQKELAEQLNSIVRVSSNDFNSTGTIISSDGYIVTNYQIISAGEEITVTFGEEEWKAEVVSSNAQLNLALIKVEANSLQPIHWEVAEEAEIGEQVFTLSYSRLEILDKYVSSGVISGVRSFQSQPYLQSDVPMSFGNSGGLMVNSRGEILGILNSKANNENVEGIGFAIPINTALNGLGIVIK